MSGSPVKRAWVHFTKTVSVPGVAVQLSSNFVPDGHGVVFTNRRGNTGNFYLGTSAVNAQTDSTRKILVPGQSMELDIMDTNLIYVDADNSTDKLEVTLVSN